MLDKTYANAQIALIEHEAATLGSLSQAVEAAGYPAPRRIADPQQIPPSLDSIHLDLVVFDVFMPGIDSYALLGDLARRLPSDAFLPILATGPPLDPETRQRAMEAGAKDFLTKPVDLEDFLLHVHSLLDTRFVPLRLQETRSLLEELVERRTLELKRAQLETLELLGRVAEARDDATGHHTRRVGRLSGMLARELGLPPDEVALIARAAPLHDLGKVAIADRILLKSGGFEDEERESMREHSALGAHLLEGAKSDLLKMAGIIAASHHERWDGQGYPQGLKAEAIPLPARIVAVADAFDALTHARPYKEAWSLPEALAEIEQERGWQFDPQVVDALLRIEEREHEEIASGPARGNQTAPA